MNLIGVINTLIKEKIKIFYLRKRFRNLLKLNFRFEFKWREKYF